MALLPDLAAIHPNALTQPFWDACQRRELVLQRCNGCERFQHPPLDGCRHCGGAQLTWTPVSGRGQIFSYTVVHHPAVPQLQESVPYAAVLVELDEAPGARLVSNLLGVPPEQVEVGLPVDLAWDEIEGVVLPRFRAS